MVKRQVPERVKLREERKWIPFVRDSVREPDPGGKWIPYTLKEDAELAAIIEAANGNPQDALAGWYHALGSLKKRHGIYLIPGQIQTLLGLPVRQVYLNEREVYRIESDGRVTEQLL